MRRQNDDFFVGYLAVPAGLRVFLMYLVPALLAGFVGVGLALAANMADPGDGRFQFRQTLTGIVENEPYPVLRSVVVTDPRDGQTTPSTVVLSGPGKNGVIAEMADLEGRTVRMEGTWINRDDAWIFQVRRNTIEDVTDDAVDIVPASAPVPVGEVTLRGEIVDSKCCLGAMRPGEGKPHMACAGLCLVGGIPPFLVTTSGDGVRTYYMLADPDGGPITDIVLPHVSLAVSMSGSVEWRDDLLVMRVDPESIEAL